MNIFLQKPIQALLVKTSIYDRRYRLIHAAWWGKDSSFPDDPLWESWENVGHLLLAIMQGIEAVFLTAFPNMGLIICFQALHQYSRTPSPRKETPL